MRDEEFKIVFSPQFVGHSSITICRSHGVKRDSENGRYSQVAAAGPRAGDGRRKPTIDRQGNTSFQILLPKKDLKCCVSLSMVTVSGSCGAALLWGTGRGGERELH